MMKSHYYYYYYYYYCSGLYVASIHTGTSTYIHTYIHKYIQLKFLKVNFNRERERERRTRHLVISAALLASTVVLKASCKHQGIKNYTVSFRS